MPLYIALPVSSNNSQVVGGAYVFEISAAYNASTVSSHIGAEPETINTDIPDVGWTTDQVATADWEYPADSGQATNIRVFRVTSIGSNFSPSVSDLNQTKLITEYFHSTHSNSLKNDGNGAYTYSRGNYSYDSTNLQFNITGEDSVGLDQVGTTYSPNETIGDWHRTPTNDRGNIYFNGVLWESQTSQQEDTTSGSEGLAWYQGEVGTNYFDNITESNFFNNHTDVTNKRKNHRRAMTSLAESTSTDTIEKFTKLMNLKLLDRLIDADDFREAERFALSRLTESQQTEIKNIIRYS